MGHSQHSLPTVHMLTMQMQCCNHSQLLPKLLQHDSRLEHCKLHLIVSLLLLPSEITPQQLTCVIQ